MTSADPQKGEHPGRQPGYRAAEAFVRPTPMYTHGEVVRFGFDLRNCTFSLSLTASSPTKQEAPTEVFLPDFHFPQSRMSIDASGGKWSVSSEDHGGTFVQILRWWHAEGDQTITVKGVKRRQGVAISNEEEEGYLEQCQQTNNCILM